MMFRLPVPWGSLIDRKKVINFSFEGMRYKGFEGDTLASALAANGVLMISRSFKYHRPRGAFSFAGLDANSYVQVGDQPNVLADQLVLYEGLDACAQNVLGSLQHDWGAATGLLSRFLPPGFYYRSFFRPRGVWPWWEKLFRRAAGLGRINTQAEHGHYDKQYLFADVAVIGGGPAGMSAALAAARAGARVILIDEGVALGGSLGYARFGFSQREVNTVQTKLVSEVFAEPGIRVLDRTCATGWFADNWLALHKDTRLFKLRARQVIAASGSVEQPMVFRNNDLPGVLPNSAVQRLLRLYGVVPGHKIVIATANTEGYDLARDLCEAGQAPVLLIDLNTQTADSESASWLQAHGVEVLYGHTVTEAVPGPGKRRIRAVVVTPLKVNGKPGGPSDQRSADTLVTSVGYAPLAQLLCQAGARLEYDDSVNSLAVTDLPSDAWMAGSLAHAYDLSTVLKQGEIAGQNAASQAGFGDLPVEELPADPLADRLNHPWPVFPHADGKDFVDFDEDQTVADLQQSVLDGFDHPELAKRYTTIGMGPSQGRLSSLNALRIVQSINSQELAGTGMTTQRPPFKPLSIGLLAGRNFQPERLTPMHQWHLDHGAELMPAGLWQRPAYYGRDTSRQQAIEAEVKAVRKSAGLIDVSTLGGIEIRGPEAAAFINRCYTFTYLHQVIGTTRYLLMCDETGAIVDDGVAYRIAEDHFYMTTTTTGSDAVYRSMLRHIAEWGMEVSIFNATSAWAAMNLAGPHSRRIIEKLSSNIDFSAQAFPYLGGRSGLIGGASAMALRVGFVGELGFELHVPWSSALETWKALVTAGEEFSLRPVGVEAQRILRLEKGHLIVGQDTDGLTFPNEAGLDWAVKTDKGYFTGGPAIRFLNENGLTRQMTGFQMLDSSADIPRECNLVLSGDEITGRVTSVARSATLGAVIGLAYLAPDQAAPGSEFNIKLSDGRLARARCVELPFYDPEKQRQAL